MKIAVWVQGGDAEAEITLVGQPWSPDVLTDLCHRAAELVITQRATDLVLAESEDE